MSTARRWRRRSVEPAPASSFVSGALARMGGTDKAREHRVFSSYVAAVGEMLAARSQPEHTHGTTLYVRASSSAVAHELTVLKREIIQKMTVRLGPGVVEDLRTRVGPLRAPR